MEHGVCCRAWVRACVLRGRVCCRRWHSLPAHLPSGLPAATLLVPPRVPPPVPLLQLAKVRNQLESEQRGSGPEEAVAAKEAELERERRALAQRQEEEQKCSRESEKVQVGVECGGVRLCRALGQ